jgi:microcystin-dependent protein
MAEPFIGQIILVGFNFAPRGYAFCQGQLLSIAQNTALFSLLGTTYGGDGQTTFALPDLRGRAAVGMGQGPGLSLYDIGERSGTESVTLLSSQMPQHTHAIDMSPVAATANARNVPGNSRSPVGAVPAVEASGVTATYSTAAPTGTTMAASAISLTGTPTVGIAGGSQPLSILQPFLVLNYCIALEGIFPSRS